MNSLLLICLAALYSPCYSQGSIRVLAYETSGNKTSSYKKDVKGQLVNVQERICITLKAGDIDVNSQTITIKDADLSPIFGASTSIAANLDESHYKDLDPAIKAKILSTLTYEGLMKAAIIIYHNGDKYYNAELKSIDGPVKKSKTEAFVGIFAPQSSHHKIVLQYFDPLDNPDSLQVSMVDSNKVTIDKGDARTLNDMFFDQAGKVRSVNGIRAFIRENKKKIVLPLTNPPLIYALPLKKLPNTKKAIDALVPLPISTPYCRIIQIAIGGGGMLMGNNTKHNKFPKLKTIFATDELLFVMIDGWVDERPIAPVPLVVVNN